METGLEGTHKSTRQRAAESLDDVRRSFNMTDRKKIGGNSTGNMTTGNNNSTGTTHVSRSHQRRPHQPQSSMMTSGGSFSGRQAASSADGRYHHDSTYRAAAEGLASMIGQRESEMARSFSPRGVSFSPPRTSTIPISLPPKGRSSAYSPQIPSHEEMIQVMQNQTAYLKLLEAENNYSREELRDLKVKTGEVVAENKTLHEEMKTLVSTGLTKQPDSDTKHVRRATSANDVIDVSRESKVRVDSSQKFEAELDRINAMHVAKNRRLESQLALSKEEVKRLEEEVEVLKRTARQRESQMMQSTAYQDHQNGAIINPVSPALTFNQNSYDRIIRERNDLVDTVSQLKSKLDRMKHQEQELYEQLTESIETVEQAKLEETQAIVQSRQLSEELSNMQTRFDEALVDCQRRVEEERRLVVREAAQIHENSRGVEELLAQREADVDRLERRVKQLEGQLEEARLQVRAYEKDYAKTRDDLQSSLTRAVLHRDQAVAELNRMRQQLDSEQHDRQQERQIFKSEVADLRARLTTAEHNLMQSNEDRIRLTNETQSIQRELDQLKLQRESLERGRSDEVNAQRSAAHQRESQLRGQLAELEARSDNTARELQDIIDRHSYLIAKLRDECKVTVGQLETLKSRYHEETSQLKTEKEHSTTRAAKVSDKNKELENQCVEHARTHDKMRSRLAQLEDQVQTMAQQILIAKQNALVHDRLDDSDNMPDSDKQRHRIKGGVKEMTASALIL